MDKEYKILYAILYIPPIVGTIIFLSIYGWDKMAILWLIIPGWALVLAIFSILFENVKWMIHDRIEEYRYKIKLYTIIRETFNFSKKQWRSLSKDVQSNLSYNPHSLKIIKIKILSTISESVWLKMELNEKVAIINKTVSILQKELQEQQLLKQNEIQKRKIIQEQNERERLEREEVNRKTIEERQKQKFEYEKRQKLIELEKQKKIDEEKRQQEKILRLERRDQEYKERIKRELLEKERKMELESEAIKELVADGKLTIDHFKEHDRRPIPSHIKQAVWKRDKQTCVNCGSQKDLEFDHVVPVSMGGSNSLNNIQLLCLKCNRTKSNKIM